MPDSFKGLLDRRAWVIKRADAAYLAVYAAVVVCMLVVAGNFDIGPILAIVVAVSVCFAAYTAFASRLEASKGRQLWSVVISAALVASAAVVWPSSVPKPPSGLVAEASYDSVTLRWDRSTDDEGVAAYELSRGPDGEPSQARERIFSGRETSFQDQKVTPGRTYVYALKVLGSKGKASPEVQVTATVRNKSQSLKPPANLLVKVLSSHKVALTWLKPSQDADVAFSVIRNGKKIAQTTEEHYVDNTAEPSTSYTFTLRTVDQPNNEESADSAAVAVTTPASSAGAPGGPTPPQTLQQSTSADGKTTVTWEPSTSDTQIIAYRIYRDGAIAGISVATNFQFAEAVTSDATVTVRALDADGRESADSAPLKLVRVAPADTIVFHECSGVVSGFGRVPAGRVLRAVVESNGRYFPSAEAAVVDPLGNWTFVGILLGDEGIVYRLLILALTPSESATLNEKAIHSGSYSISSLPVPPWQTRYVMRTVGGCG